MYFCCMHMDVSGTTRTAPCPTAGCAFIEDVSGVPIWSQNLPLYMAVPRHYRTLHKLQIFTGAVIPAACNPHLWVAGTISAQCLGFEDILQAILQDKLQAWHAPQMWFCSIMTSLCSVLGKYQQYDTGSHRLTSQQQQHLDCDNHGLINQSINQHFYKGQLGQS